MFFRRHTDKLLIPIILAIVFVASSYRSKYHLRPEMPPAFFAEKGTPASALEKKVAQAYWKTARSEIQWRYGYGHPLPTDPPGEFQIDSRELSPAASDPTTRLLYWHRLQQVWYLPETWYKDYGWDFAWVGDPLASGADWIKQQANRLFSN